MRLRLNLLAPVLAWMALVIICLVGPTALTAHAQTGAEAQEDTAQGAETVANPRREARRLFEEGVAMTEQERWGEALEYFRRSRALVDRPSTTFNIAVALLRLGRPTEAMRALEDFLRSDEGAPNSAKRRQARELLEMALKSIARLDLRVGPENAEVRVNGELQAGAGLVREIVLDPGRHTVRVTAEGFEAQTFEVSMLDGERVQRELTLERVVDTTTELEITANVPGATIYVDGVPVGASSWRAEVTPGRHDILVEADGHETFRREVQVTEGDRISLVATLARVAEEPSVWSSPWLWVGVGVAVVGAGTVAAIMLSNDGNGYGGTTGIRISALSF